MNDDAPSHVPEIKRDLEDPNGTIPLPRYNAMLAVLRNTLYMFVHFNFSPSNFWIHSFPIGHYFYRYGGIYERGSHEYTLDDFYSLQLDKMDQYVCLKESGIIIGDDEGSSSDDEDDEDDSDDEDEDEDGTYVEDAPDGNIKVDFESKGEDVLEPEVEQTQDEKVRPLNVYPSINQQYIIPGSDSFEGYKLHGCGQGCCTIC